MDDGQICGLKFVGALAIVWAIGEYIGVSELHGIDKWFDETIASDHNLKYKIRACDEYLDLLYDEIDPASIRPIYRICGYRLRKKMEKIRDGLIKRR